MKMTMEELNGICMEMISNAGEGRSKVFEALDSVNKGDYKTAAARLDEAQALLAEAHKIQFEQLMGPQNSGTEIPFSMLLLHAMDMTMVSTSEHDMLRSVVEAKLDQNNA
ncbi:MAG TPA: PTS lactose/cellobiose transporter subunit IIA [Candidatus Fournierella merdavium]|uniref:PTS lactose/cellobiose transporter subunit IIA n=1 Tax=Candidatus Allofournierella merdavium TaxID=2838593 RepID=UPI001F85852D|nr:PTS lactose/cellobiose transporter subunit IIA [Candidatus Fournierella merdavium]